MHPNSKPPLKDTMKTQQLTCKPPPSGQNVGGLRGAALMLRRRKSTVTLRPIRYPLLALFLLGALGCSTTASVTPTVSRQPPTACLEACPALPELSDGQEGTRRRWESSLISRAGECRLLHAECSAYVTRSAEPEKVPAKSWWKFW